MRQITPLLLLLSFSASCMFVQTGHVFAQSNQLQPAATQQQNARDSAQDIVYAENEVDVKAQRADKPKPINIKKSDAHFSPFMRDCPAQGVATVRFIINKSGKVTEATIDKESGCRSFDKKMVQNVRKLKFTPALKDGQPVSQHAQIEFSYFWPRGRS